jgi:hypothetical protein
MTARFHGHPIAGLGELPDRTRLALLAQLQADMTEASLRHAVILAARPPVVPADPDARRHVSALLQALDGWRQPHSMDRPQPRTCPGCRHAPQARPKPMGA